MAMFSLPEGIFILYFYRLLVLSYLDYTSIIKVPHLTYNHMGMGIFTRVSGYLELHLRSCQHIDEDDTLHCIVNLFFCRPVVALFL